LKALSNEIIKDETEIHECKWLEVRVTLPIPQDSHSLFSLMNFTKFKACFPHSRKLQTSLERASLGIFRVFKPKPFQMYSGLETPLFIVFPTSYDAIKLQVIMLINSLLQMSLTTC
jgi:hypothetical protein